MGHNAHEHQKEKLNKKTKATQTHNHTQKRKKNNKGKRKHTKQQTPTQNENKANTQNNKYDNNLLAKEPNKNITQIKTIKDKMFSFVELAASSTPERYQQSRLRGVTKRGMAQPRSKSRK